MTRRYPPGDVMTNAQLRETWTETEFQKNLISLAGELGWHSYHTRYSLGSQGGYPDLTLWKRGCGVIFAELKDMKRKATPAQARTLQDLTDAGERAYLWRPSDWDEIAGILGAG